MPDPETILIKGGRVIRMVGPVRAENLDILVRKDRIAEIGPGLSARDATLIDASGCLVVPGFIDTHRHTWQTQLRGVATDWSLFEYLVHMRLIYSSCYEPEDVYLGNYLGTLEALNAGITTLVDHCHIINSPEHADAAMQALKDANGRALFCYGLFSNPRHHPFRLEEDPSWRLRDAQRIRRILSGDSELVTFGLAPNEVESLPFEASVQEIQFARELAVKRMSFHVAMGAYDQRHRYVERLGGAGLLGEDMLFVHGSALTDHELTLIRHHGAAVSSTPETELQMGMGFPVAERVRAAGGTVSLGIDIVSSCSGDMFAQMRLLLQASRALGNAGLERHGNAPRVIAPPAEVVLSLATRGGAHAAGVSSQTGCLEIGKQADIVLLRTDTLMASPAAHEVACVMNASPADVDTVTVAGRILKRHGRMIGVNLPELISKLKDSHERIAARASRIDPRPIEAIAARWFSNLQ